MSAFREPAPGLTDWRGCPADACAATTASVKVPALTPPPAIRTNARRSMSPPFGWLRARLLHWHALSKVSKPIQRDVELIDLRSSWSGLRLRKQCDERTVGHDVVRPWARLRDSFDRQGCRLAKGKTCAGLADIHRHHLSGVQRQIIKLLAIGRPNRVVSSLVGGADQVFRLVRGKRLNVDVLPDGVEKRICDPLPIG